MAGDQGGGRRLIRVEGALVAFARSRRRQRTTDALIVLVAASLLATVQSGAPAAVVLAVVGLLGSWTKPRPRMFGARPAGRAMTVDADADGLRLHDARAMILLRPDDLVDGLAVVEPSSPERRDGYERVLIGLRDGRRLTLTMSRSGAAAEVVEILGLARRRVELEIVQREGARAVFAALLTLVGGLTALVALIAVVRVIVGIIERDLGAAFVLAVVGLIAAALAGIFIRGGTVVRLRIAPDGVLLERMLGRRRFFRAETLTVRVEEALLELRDGTRTEALLVDPVAAAAIAARIAAVCARAASPGGDPRLLACGGRTIAEWRAALASTAGSAIYRGDLPPDEIEAILDDPHATPDARVGAAVVLALQADGPETRERISSAASASADPALERALAAVASGEIDEALLRARRC
jgi:hypothetical protein